MAYQFKAGDTVKVTGDTGEANHNLAIGTVLEVKDAGGTDGFYYCEPIDEFDGAYVFEQDLESYKPAVDMHDPTPYAEQRQGKHSNDKVGQYVDKAAALLWGDFGGATVEQLVAAFNVKDRDPSFARRLTALYQARQILGAGMFGVPSTKSLIELAEWLLADEEAAA